MEIEHKDFIGIYKNAMSLQDCDFVIQTFEKHLTTNPPDMSGDTQFTNEKLGRSDTSIFMETISVEAAKRVNETLKKCMDVYSNQFFTVKIVEAKSDNVKVQRTPPRGGYHVWHSEVSNRVNMERCMVWMVYLNTIPEGEGETEFLWQGLRVKPEAGTCVLWPAGYTHVHRGNPVYSKDKYVATGWYCYK